VKFDFLFVSKTIYLYGIWTEFGVKIGEIVASGQLVSSDLLAPLMEHETKNCSAPAGWLLDGNL
jgi:adenylate kinase family enzyme